MNVTNLCQHMLQDIAPEGIHNPLSLLIQTIFTQYRGMTPVYTTVPDRKSMVQLKKIFRILSFNVQNIPKHFVLKFRPIRLDNVSVRFFF